MDGIGDTIRVSLSEEPEQEIPVAKAILRHIDEVSGASGDYVMGLEPANSSVYGKLYHIKENSLHKMEPFAVERKKIVLTFLSGGELEAERSRLKEFLHRTTT